MKKILGVNVMDETLFAVYNHPIPL